MIDFEAFFKISYGLYLVSSGDKEYGNGYVSNTVFQITAQPARFAASCNKDNHTSEVIDKYGCFAVSVLHENTDSEVYGRFGYKSGKDINKMEGMDVKYGQTGAPIVLNDCAAYLEFKVVDKFDVGTHIVYIGELVAAEIVNDSLEPITYSYYRKVKKGLSPKNAPTYIDKTKIKSKPKTGATNKYQCAACGYVYDESDEDNSFKELPDDWKCPVCGADKEDFFQV